MSNKINLFISYCKEENNNNNQKEWIAEFNKYIAKLLERLIGQIPTIFTSGSKKDTYKLSDINSFLIIVSQDYFSSKSCLKEFDEIINQKNESTFALNLAPLKVESIPEAYNNIPNYNFYIEKEKSEDFVAINSSNEFLFWFKLIGIVYDIYHTLPQEVIKDKQLVNGNKKSIFLAETSGDQILKRDLLKKELQLHGYKIYPDKPLSRNIQELEKQITEYLDISFLSIHIIGNYACYLDENKNSLIQIQNDIAYKYIANNRSTNAFLFRLIWLPPNLEIANDEHKNYIELLKRDKKLMESAEMIQTPLEEFKNIIQFKISDIEKLSLSQKDKKKDDSFLIYLIYEKEDAKDITIITETIKKNGYNVITTSYSDQEIKNIEEHRENLIKSDAVIVYYGNENLNWIQTKLKELAKIAGYGKTKPFISKTIVTKNEYLGINNILYKDFDIIKVNGIINNQMLKPFFEKLGKINGK